jgi:hypothetical protein
MPTTRFKGPLLASSESGAGLFEGLDVAEPGRFHTAQYYEEFDSPSKLFGCEVFIGPWAQSTAYTPGPGAGGNIVYNSTTGEYYICTKSGTSSGSGTGPTGDGIVTIVDKAAADREVRTQIVDGTCEWEFLRNGVPEGATASDWYGTRYKMGGRVGVQQSLYWPGNSAEGVLHLSTNSSGAGTDLCGITLQNDGLQSNRPGGFGQAGSPLLVGATGKPTPQDPGTYTNSTITFGARVYMFKLLPSAEDPYENLSWFVGLSELEADSTLYSGAGPWGPGSSAHAGFFMKGDGTGKLWAGGQGAHIDIGWPPAITTWMELGMRIVDGDCFMVYMRNPGQSTKWKKVGEGMASPSWFDSELMIPTIAVGAPDGGGTYSNMILGVDYFFLNQKRDLKHYEWDGNTDVLS